MAIADANIILRYLLNNHEELSTKAEEILAFNSQREITLLGVINGYSLISY